MTGSSEGAASQDRAAGIGRGALLLTITKLWFLVSGYVLVFGLTRILDKEDFGKYGVVIGFIGVINALVIQGTTQAVSRFVARHPDRSEGVRRAAWRLQLTVGGGFLAAILVTAPWVSSRLWRDPSLATPLRWAAGITFFYAFYAIAMGWLNGRRAFERQALVDFSFSTIKLTGVLVGAAILADTLGPVAAPVAGFAAAAAITLLLALVVARGRGGPGSFSVKELVRFQVLTMGFTFLITLIARVDLQILKAGTPGGQAAVDAAAGDYYGAQQFAAIPYQLVYAITFVLFPLVAIASDRDPGAIRTYARNTLSYAAMIITLVGALFLACPERTLTILLPASYVTAAPILRILVLGYMAFSMFFVATTIITASGRPQVSIGLATAVAALQVGLGSLLVGRFGPLGVASATAIAMTMGLILAHWTCLRRFGQGLPLRALALCLACGAGVGLVAQGLFAHQTLLGGKGLLAEVGGGGLLSRVVTVVGFGGLGLLYVAALARLGVLTPEDRSRIARIFRRGRQP